MKFLFISVYCLALSALYISCANPQSDMVLFPESDTLRSAVNTHNQTVTWVSEIEPEFLGVSDESEQNPKNDDSGNPLDFLKSQLLGMENVENKQNTTNVNTNAIADVPLPLSLGVVSANQKPLYPDLDGFGSLDTSLIPQKIKSLLDSYIMVINNPDESKKYLSPNRKWLPYIVANRLLSLDKIDSWFYGKPYISPDEKHPVYEIPVRLQFKTADVDLLINLSAEDTLQSDSDSNATNESSIKQDNGDIQVSKNMESDFDFKVEQFLLKNFLIDQVRIKGIVYD